MPLQTSLDPDQTALLLFRWYDTPLGSHIGLFNVFDKYSNE